MVSEIKVYKVKDFVRKNLSGELDMERTMEMVHNLSALATFHSDHNLLIDLRETAIGSAGMSEIFQVAMEFAVYKSIFKNKIANVIPADKDRLAVAEQFQACMQVHDFEYRFFTDFEEAIEWLSEVSTVDGRG